MDAFSSLISLRILRTFSQSVLPTEFHFLQVAVGLYCFSAKLSSEAWEPGFSTYILSGTLKGGFFALGVGMDQLRALLALRCPAGLLYQGNCCQYLWVSPLGLARSPKKFSLFCLGAGTGLATSCSVNTHLTPSFLLVLMPSTVPGGPGARAHCLTLSRE